METAANVATVISGLMDIILFVIAVYTFYLTFLSEKVTILTFGYSYSMWKSDTINFLIKNKTLKTIIISKVYAVFDNKYRLQVRKYEIPVVLDSFQSIKIEMEPYTSMHGMTMHELSNIVDRKAKIHLEIITDENKTIYAAIKGRQKYKPNKKAKLEQIVLFTSKFGEIVLKEDYKYILRYRVGENGNVETAFINNGGLISTDIFGFNALPQECLSNKEDVKKLLTEPCKKLNIALLLTDVNELHKNPKY